MRCPKCGTHDNSNPDDPRGVFIILPAYSGQDMMNLILTGEKPKPLPDDGKPKVWCSECDYTAADRAQYDRDIEAAKAGGTT